MRLGLVKVLSDGQSIAIRQLERIANADQSALTIDQILTPERENDYLSVDISLDCRHYEHLDGGLKYNNFETFNLIIPPEFPFVVPRVYSGHKRFSGFPHVQWGNYLCLYLSTEVQWQPSAGMIGLINQLNQWLSNAARNELDPIGGPIHPPVAYKSCGTTITVQADTPDSIRWPWFGAAILREKKSDYFELTHWEDIDSIDRDQVFAPALLLDFELPIEYPKKVADLFAWIKEKGLDTNVITIHLMLAARRLDEGEPLRFVIGTPSRGVVGDAESRLQHIEVWEINVADALILKTVALSCELLAHYQNSSLPEDTIAIIKSVFKELDRWKTNSQIHWCTVFENRHEIVTRRDAETPMDWFLGKSVVLWGCGALGSQVAEQLVRAGVKKIVIFDNRPVHPGILVRQNFVDADINDSKAVALERRLKAIAPENIKILSNFKDILTELNTDNWQGDADVIIDATASLRVRSKLEKVLKRVDRTVSIVAMLLSGQVRFGAMVVVPADYSGGTLDAFRRLGLAAKHRFWLRDAAEAFWGSPREESVRQSEPGCSEPTFVGSQTDISAMASRMLNQAAQFLQARSLRCRTFLQTSRRCGPGCRIGRKLCEPGRARGWMNEDRTAPGRGRKGRCGGRLRPAIRLLRGPRASEAA